MVGIWLIQLGTPEAPTASALRPFLREFLMDKRVIDIPFIFRWILVNLIIVPFRASKSAAAYRKIWSTQGSPLRFHSVHLAEELQKKFSARAVVKLAMRYGSPSLQSIWSEFKKEKINKIIIMPLYPQYASASTGTVLEKINSILSKEKNPPQIAIIPPFYKEDFFIQSFVERAKQFNLSNYDHILFSFHGIPERQITKIESCRNHCFKTPNCCDKPVLENALCYRHQCSETAKRIADKLSLPSEKWTLCFQSRLGRTPWIKPFTDQIILDLAQKGVKKVLVFSPSFVADCLETLEEIQVREAENFKAVGGQELTLVPSLNSEAFWVDRLSYTIANFL